MLRIPRWLRPPAVELERSAEMRAAVLAAERGDDVSAAVSLRVLRESGGISPQACGLYAWTLRRVASSAEAERAARADLRRCGEASPAVHYALAVALETDGRAAEALDSYLLVLQADPNDAALLRACARVALAGGRPHDALPHLELLADGAPDDPLLLADLATAVHADALTGGEETRRARARGLLREVLLLDPQHAGAQRMLGESLAASGERDAAVTALRRALELDPAAVAAGLQLARLLYEAGQRAGAIAVLRDLLRQPLAPDQVGALRELLRIFEEA